MSYTITIQTYKVTEIYHYPLSYLIQLMYLSRESKK